MGCSQLVGANPRISARRGQVADLNVDFYKNGILTDPYAIRSVEIYKTQVLPHNLVTTVSISDPDDAMYPVPLCRDYVVGDVPSTSSDPEAALIQGRFHLPYFIPNDFTVPDVYFDLWYYFADSPCDLGTEPTNCDLSDPLYEPMLLKCCHRFWVYPEDWFCNDRLQTIRFGFEPLDQRFYSPEMRTLEVGVMPLPLYDYNYNLVAPLIPFISTTISITTQRCETLIENEPCRIGIRQGSYRSNPWVIQYDLDTTRFLRGTYQYQLTMSLPDGSTRVSQKFILVIA